MQVEVVTPTGPAASRAVDEVVAPGALGEIGILPGHVALITGLRTGVVTLKGQGATEVFAVGPGFLQVLGPQPSGEDRVIVLTERAERASEIDAAAAQRELAEIEKALGTWDREPDAEYEALYTRRAWAMARLAAAR